MGYSKLINKMTFSFSRLHLYETCPYAFYLKYIQEKKGLQNFYSENGSVMHSIFERLLKGKIKLENAPNIYLEEFDSICNTTKQSIMDTTFEKCMDYLCCVDEIDKNRYEILLVEEEMNFKIGKYSFKGYADCVLKDKLSNQIILIDHKSSNHLFKKDGTPLKNMADYFYAYQKQMYTYCKAIKDIYRIHVDLIAWHHFKDNGRISVIPFNKEDYEATLKWAVDLIQKIKKDQRFQARKSYMMDKELCDYREVCEYLEMEE